MALLATWAVVSGFMATRHRASARRSVASLGDTSTMRVPPNGSRWLRLRSVTVALPSFTAPSVRERPAPGTALALARVDCQPERRPGPEGTPRVPTYEYRCDNCATNFDVVQSFHDDPLTECPTCGVAGAQGLRQRGHRLQGQRLLQDRQPVGRLVVEAGRVHRAGGVRRRRARTGRPTSAGSGSRLRRDSSPSTSVRRVGLGRPAAGSPGRLAGSSGSTGERRRARRPPPRLIRRRSRRTGPRPPTVGDRPVTGRRSTTLRSSPSAQSGPVQWIAWTSPTSTDC